jgi:hypothetical protein
VDFLNKVALGALGLAARGLAKKQDNSASPQTPEALIPIQEPNIDTFSKSSETNPPYTPEEIRGFLSNNNEAPIDIKRFYEYTQKYPKDYRGYIRTLSEDLMDRLIQYSKEKAPDNEVLGV